MCALCTLCAYWFLSPCSSIQHFSASILCGQGHELRSYCSISFYVRVQNSRQMWPLKSNVPHLRCSKYRDTTLKANHILSCFSRAFPLNVNQMLQGCSFFASTTHGSLNRPLPNLTLSQPSSLSPLTFLKDTLSSSCMPALIVRPFIK